MSNSIKQKHILLSSVGISGPKETRYTDGELHAEANFSAFGLWQLLPHDQRPDEAWFLLTPLAKEKCWAEIQSEAALAGTEVHAIELSGNDDDTREFLEQTAAQLPRDCRLTLNVTEGLRHHAFLFYALALYLTEFRDVQIAGVWYCRLETDNRDDPKPLIDLKPVLELAKWFHAIASFREQGTTKGMARLVELIVANLREQAKLGNNDHALHKLASDVAKYAETFESYAFSNSTAMPLELGKAARKLSDRIVDLPVSVIGKTLPMAESLANAVAEIAESVAFRQLPTSSGKWKSGVELNRSELDRQARMVDLYLERGQLSLAAGLMREWVVSWLIWKTGNVSGWLEYAKRKPFEQRLGRLLALVRSQDELGIELDESMKEFASFWSRLSDGLRNSLHHHGMRLESMESEPKELAQVRNFWQTLKADEISLPELGGGHGRLLICPIGHTPGVLFSAVSHTHPDRILVVCSAQTEGRIPEACTEARCDARVSQLTLADVNRGIGEFGTHFNASARWLFEADEIHACLTGGTTLMGVLVSRLANHAKTSYQRPVRDCVLIDPRTPEEQRNQPWHLGDIHYLDDQ